ncbi:MAG: MarR family transcriptional regulator [Desulfobulbus propionicus]|nr:MAG: MarR family transcriptional regulator [Desulfobulbus propionicus]
MDQRPDKIHAIIRQLRIVFRVVQTHAKSIEKECGLSGAKLWMLYEINANPGLKVSELATALTIHPSTCSNMLDRLEDLGLVSRGRSKKDQRTVHLFLTDDGRSLLARAPRPVQGKLSDALDRLADNQLCDLQQSLDNLIQNLQQPDNVALVPLSEE